MKELWNYIQLVFTAIGGWLGWFLGGCDGLLYALLAFVVIDYLTGVLCAIADQKLSSAIRTKTGNVTTTELDGCFLVSQTLFPK